jgi:hypothetical protein
MRSQLRINSWAVVWILKCGLLTQYFLILAIFLQIQFRYRVKKDEESESEEKNREKICLWA